VVTTYRSRRATALTCYVVIGVAMVTANGTAAAAGQAAPAGRPSPSTLARSALQGVLRQATQKSLDATVRQAHRGLAEHAARTPDAPTSASLVLTDGLGASAAAGLLSRHRLDLISVEAKEPVGTSGEVQTMWFSDFDQLDGTLSEKLERTIGKARFRYFRQASVAPAAEKAKLRELATGDIRLYRLEVAATYGTLAGLVDQPSILAVLPDADDRKVIALRERRAKFGHVQRTKMAAPPVRLSSGDPARRDTGAGTPVITNTGQRCAWSRPEGVLACQPATQRSVSGDPLVDSMLPDSAGALTAGSTTKPASGSAAKSPTTALGPPSVYVNCNQPADTQNCPNDFTYAPRPETGGSQSLAAVVHAYPTGYVYWYDCYIVWVPGNGGSEGDGGYWTTYCILYYQYSPAFTVGAVGWRSKWGTLAAEAEPGVVRPISTLAYKASAMTACDVDQFGATAECDKSDQDAVYVPNPGLEDEVLIGNPACTLASRYGDSSDWNSGCFWPTLAQSNLPAAYLDTTFGDGPTPYNVAIGSSAPTALIEGVNYTNYVEFFSWGYNNMLGQQAWHSVSVDSRVTLSAACAYGAVRGQPDAFCFFPVDATRVSERLTFVQS
jgi:hypothetical protein